MIRLDGQTEKGTEKQLAASFREFGDRTTFHGLRYVTNNTHHIARRFIWLAVVLGMTTWLIANIIGAFVLLYQYPEASTISVNYVPNITFPAVTLCNINTFRSDAMEPSAVELLARIFSDQSAPPGAGVDLDNIKLFPSTNKENLIHEIMQAAHQLEDMLLSCKWKSEPCSHLNFTQRLTDYGVCYTFNDPDVGRDALTVRNPGRRNGLFMRMNVQQDLYTYGESTAAGIKVLLHPQGEFPLITEFAFSLSPGFETSVAVRQQVVKSLKAPYKTNCTDGALTDFPFKYSVPTCQFECMVLYVTGKCGCRDFRWPTSLPICSLEKQVSCIYPYEDEFLSHGERCQCPVACQTTTYDSKSSMAFWPAAYLTTYSRNSTNLTDDFIRKNYLDVYIFFEEIMYMGIEQTMAYTTANLQSDIGGYLGLLCGMSLITLVEWADFIIVTLYKRFCEKN